MLTDYRPLSKNFKFLYLWASQILSQLTIYVMNFLLLLRLFEKTGSTIATSFLWVAYALPAILIGPFAAASHRTSLFLIYGVALAYSFLNQFYVPAELATLPSVVKKKVLPHANGLFFLTQT